MACHEVDGKSHDKEHRSLDREIMAQPSHNGNADCREDRYPCDAQKKAAGHRFRIEYRAWPSARWQPVQWQSRACGTSPACRRQEHSLAHSSRTKTRRRASSDRQHHSRHTSSQRKENSQIIPNDIFCLCIDLHILLQTPDDSVQ